MAVIRLRQSKHQRKRKLLLHVSVSLGSMKTHLRSLLLPRLLLTATSLCGADTMPAANLNGLPMRDKTLGKGRIGIGSFDDMNGLDDIRL